MHRLRFIAVFVLALMPLVAAPAAHAHPQPTLYSPPQCGAAVIDPQTAGPGDTIHITDTADQVVDWSVIFNGSVQTFHGMTLNAYVTAPTTPGSYDLQITCDNGLASAAHHFKIVIAATGRGLHAGILPNTGGNLPGAGGPSRWLLIAGLAAVTAGLMFLRRRHQH